MKSKNLILFIILVIFTLAGCATGRKEQEMEIQGLHNQITLLEAQVQSKDQEISVLRESMDKLTQEKEAMESSGVITKKSIFIGEPKWHPSVKQIQLALKNAGYYPGAVDGKMNKLTRQATKSFQKANKLPADGRVGKKTWAVLKPYLYKKEK